MRFREAMTSEIQLLGKYNIHDTIMEYARDGDSLQDGGNIIKDLAVQTPSHHKGSFCRERAGATTQ